MQRNFWLLFGAIWTAVGLPFLIVGLYQLNQQWQLNAESETVTGRVLSKDVTKASRDRSTEYSVRYRFQVSRGQAPEAQTWEGRDEVNLPAWESLVEGGPIEIEYLPSDPSVNRVAGEQDWVMVVVFCSLGGAFSIAGVTILAYGIRKRQLRAYLLRRGLPTTGEIVKVGPTSVRLNNVRQWRIEYRYVDHMGQTHQGKSDYLSPAMAEVWKAGDQGRVRFDPARPETSLWVGTQE